MAGLLLCAAVALAAPQSAHASVTVSTLDKMPFETAAQVAGHPIWSSSSKITTIGSAKKSSDTWYSGYTGYGLLNKGDGILIQNVGTDTSGNAYDLKIVLTAANGKTYSTLYGEGNKDPIEGHPARNFRVRLDISTEAGSLKAGKKLTMNVCTTSDSDCNLTFYYVKHGTSTAASCNFFGQIFDIDQRLGPGTGSPAVFGAYEGVILYDADVYISSSIVLKYNASNGRFWVPDNKLGNVDGKDWTKGFAWSKKSSNATITFGSGANVDLWFDYHKAPGNPSKSATITG